MENKRLLPHYFTVASTNCDLTVKLWSSVFQCFSREFFIRILENQLSFFFADEEAAHLFQFITGLDDLPARELPISVEFNRVNRVTELPEAITCVQRLILPLGNKSKMQLYSSFHKALKFGRIGFGEKNSPKKWLISVLNCTFNTCIVSLLLATGFFPTSVSRTLRYFFYMCVKIQNKIIFITVRKRWYFFCLSGNRGDTYAKQANCVTL